MGTAAKIASEVMMNATAPAMEPMVAAASTAVHSPSSLGVVTADLFAAASSKPRPTWAKGFNRIVDLDSGALGRMGRPVLLKAGRLAMHMWRE